MKKIIALILAFVMAIGGMTVIGEETEGYKQALVTVKERIGNTDEYDHFTGHVNSNENGLSYDFEWSNDSGQLAVRITEGGVITQYYCYENNDDSTPISERADKKTAEKNALDWMAEINPGVGDNILITNCHADDSGYRFGFVITHNGYRITDNSGYVIIDARAEKISRLYMTYTESPVFEEGEVIDSQSGREAFKNNIGFELQYISTWDNNFNRVVFPVYLLKNNRNKYISALTGEVIEITKNQESYKGSNSAVAESALAADSASGGFSQAELDEFEKIELTVSEQKAVDAVKNCKYFNLPTEAFDNIDIHTYDIDDKTRGYNFTFKWDGFIAWADVNAETGTILNYSKTRSDAEATITEEQAAETANEAFEYLAPEIFNQYKSGGSVGYMPIPYNDEIKPQTATFSYARYVNGIPFYDNVVTVDVDLSDNSVIGFRQYHSYLDFPAIDNVVSYDAAAEEYFNAVGFEPMYENDGEMYRLVYGPVSSDYSVDAFTGEVDVPAEDYSYSDASGHYSEKYANALLPLGIGFGGGQLKPDEPIKQKEFAALLYECVKYDGSVMIDDEYAYNDFYDAGISTIIKDKSKRNPDGNVTRLNAAEFTAFAMGYGEIGELDIYRPMFADMEHAGYASILCGLKIMNGDGNGNFNPDDVLTRAQALIIIYNYLNR